ncbi:MAG: hypothetical protein H0T84_05040 [Tatlockia sp.]|nr:hypothetical protein [Tatlockia sp.]
MISNTQKVELKTTAISIENTPLKANDSLDILLLLCRFLDDISPLAFLIPIIGQVYLGARLANNFEPLTKMNYSFFSYASPTSAGNDLILDWNYASFCS